MLFDRLQALWLGFWSRLIGQSEGRHGAVAALGAIEVHKRHLRSVRDALTNLIFQKKKLDDRQHALDAETAELKLDVEDAVKENRDELALQLIGRLQAAQDEHQFLKDQIVVLTKDIEMARETERQLATEITRAEQMSASLASRHQALRARQNLLDPLRSASAVLSKGEATLTQPLTDQIRRLEAEMESLSTRRADWEKEWEKLRTRRSRDRQMQVLSHIKTGLRRRDLPGIIVAQPVS